MHTSVPGSVAPFINFIQSLERAPSSVLPTEAPPKVPEPHLPTFHELSQPG